MKPIIGITASYFDSRYCIFTTYASAISAAGGVPIVIPFSEDEESINRIVSLCDGVLLSGGCDVAPSRYGEEILNDTVVTAPKRDKFEFKLFELANAQRKPIMAICRGMQVTNVALGGSLYQDLPSQYESDILHAQTQPKTEPSHSVNVVADTPLQRLTGSTRLTANSFHHQAVKRLGDGLIPMAYADDGIIEAFYRKEEPYLRGYQWHPERLYSIDEKTMLIFKDFVEASVGGSNEK